MSNNNDGWSLIEIMIVICLIGIGTAICLPSLKMWWQTRQHTILKQKIINHLQMAKGYAVLQSIGFCFSSANLDCAASPLQAPIIQLLTWTIRNKTCDKILSSSSVKLEGKLYFKIYPRYRQFFVFKPLYAMDDDNGTLWYCAKAQNPVWAISISKVGNIHALLPKKDGFYRDSSGNKIAC